MKATMNDVALLAGVSVTTVSHVINNTRIVAEETKNSVLRAIEALGYVPDRTARGLKTGKRNMVGFIVPNIANPVWSNIIDGAEEALYARGVTLVVMNTRETPEREAENIRTLSGGVADGMILASSMDSYSRVKELLPPGYPAVFIDREPEGCLGDAVLLSSREAVGAYVKAMAAAGHRHIGCLIGIDRLSTSREKYEAYLEAMEDCGLEVMPGFVQRIEDVGSDCSAETRGMRLAGCTAIVTSNSVLAGRVRHCLEKEGSGDTEVLDYKEETEPCTAGDRGYFVSQPFALMGKLAGERLLQRIGRPEMSPVRTVLKSALAAPDRG